MEDCHISHNSIVCMLELPMPAEGLDRCVTIFTRGKGRGFVYGG